MADPKAPPHILLIEDEPAHVELFSAFFDEKKTPVHLHVARDGLEAWNFLQGKPPHEEAVRPGLIFLDLGLPTLSGLELLERIKADKALRGIPVVVLTVSDEADDARAVYDLNATAFITKPSTVEEFTEMMRRIEAFWLHLVDLPSRSRDKE